MITEAWGDGQINNKFLLVLKERNKETKRNVLLGFLFRNSLKRATEVYVNVLFLTNSWMFHIALTFVIICALHPRGL